VLIDGTPGEELLLAFTFPVHFRTFAYTFVLLSSPPYSGPTGPWLLSLNIWRPPFSKLENNLEDATQKTKLAHPATGRRSLTRNLCLEPATYL
jgi:hypothetical protein